MNGVMTTIGIDNTVIHKEYTDKIPLKDLQEAVGGYIEAVPGFAIFDGERCVAFCNEHGKLTNLHLNPLATTAWYEALGQTVGDYLVGPVVVITGDDEFMRTL